jgi:hypothetical protein
VWRTECVEEAARLAGGVVDKTDGEMGPAEAVEQHEPGVEKRLSYRRVNLLIRDEPGGEQPFERRRTYFVERAERGDAPKRAPVEAVEAIRPAGV